MSATDFTLQQSAQLQQHGIKVQSHAASQLSLHVPYCGSFVTIGVEVFADTAQPTTHVVLDVVLPRDLPLGALGLTELTVLAAPVAVSASKGVLLSLVQELMAHVLATHTARAKQLTNARWQFELNTFLLQQRAGAAPVFPAGAAAASVAVAVPLPVELPKHFSLYGSDTRTASLLVRFDLARMTAQAPQLSLLLPNRLERLLFTAPLLPRWDVASDCLSLYMPKACQFLDDFCHGLRVRRAVLNALVKLLGSKLEVDHVHYQRGRYMRRTVSTNPPTVLILHVDLPLAFPMSSPQLGISCLTWLDDGSSSRDGISRPFSRAIPLASWNAADMPSTELLANAIAQALVGAVDGFVRKAVSGTRNTVYFIKQ